LAAPAASTSSVGCGGGWKEDEGAGAGEGFLRAADWAVSSTMIGSGTKEGEVDGTFLEAAASAVGKGSGEGEGAFLVGGRIGGGEEEEDLGERT